MAKEYRYADAVRLLGGADPAVATIDLWLSVGTLGLWDMIDAKQQFVQVGNALLGRWREWRAGREWHSRTERIEAAHTILVITAFFEALDAIDLPFSAQDLRMSKEEQTELARRSGLDLSHGLACPSPYLPFEQAKQAVLGFYERCGHRLRSFLRGLRVWDELAPSEREKIIAQLERTLPKAAVRRYEDRYRSLALDVPEFALWVGMIEHQATRAGLSELERLLSLVSSGAALPNQLTTLSRLHRAALKEPLAATRGSDETATAARLPTVEEAYMTPRFRAGEVRHSTNPSVEAWWEDLEVREDLPRFLAGFLTRSTASEVPFVILGQPGAGKSLLTKVLAARLPEGRYLPVRVPLREVAANADIQEQIEQAVYRLSGERLEWPALARSAVGVLPVVLLDGFDELLQATGVRQSDYLEKVARFQRREIDAGRAVAVVITSRTAVADRTAFVPGTVVARLEPFSEAQIDRWLTAWNAKNDAYFAGRRIKPLALDVALAQRALAEQPLLLLMLALYDADGNALSKDVAEFRQTELYERLMRRFVERELEKACPRDQVPAFLEREMLHLSYVAFAMFNRGRQWVTTAELDQDLSGLEFPAQVRTGTFATPLTAGELSVAKFFFIHRAQATRDHDVVQTYEFLHATFGEYLIARLIITLLADLAVKESGLVVTEVDDALLQTLLSWSALSSRTTIVSFLRELVETKGAGDRWGELVVRLFRRLDTRLRVPYPNYRPGTAGLARRHAYHSANLMMIALACEGVLRAGALLPGHEDPLTEWRRHALLWRSQCAAGEWASLSNTVQVDLVSSQDGAWDLELRLDLSGRTQPPVPVGWMENAPLSDHSSADARAIWHGVFLPPRSPSVEAAPEASPGYPEPAAEAPNLLLDRVAEVCEARHERATIRKVTAEPPYLLITVPEDGFVRQYLIGAHLGRVAETDVEAFLRHVHAAVPGPGSELVYQGPAPADEVRDYATRRGIRLRSFIEFQGLLDLSDYVMEQTRRLRSDRRYPPGLYVPQRWHAVDQPGSVVSEDLVGELMRLLAADHGRFTLVLGDFGRGKTFALRELARRIPGEVPHLTPIFIELRALEKAQSVDAMVAAHLAAHGVKLIDLNAFRYLLREGRIVLLFDGFDELVTRVSYERAADHLGTLLAVAEGKTKIVVTSRTQHFRSHGQVLTAMGEMVGVLPQRRVLSVEDFTPAQVRAYLLNRYGDEAAAEDRFALIGGISDLLGLAQNPRMLSLVADLPGERLRMVATAGGAISPAGLYEEILSSWLAFEEHRVRVPGSAAALSIEELWQAVTALALRLWESGESLLGVEELTEIGETLTDLAGGRVSAAHAAHAVGSGSLLVRTEEGMFGFIHFSVLEWLIARYIASGDLAPLSHRSLSALTVEFLCDLADVRWLLAWVRRTLADADADDISRSNAVKISIRLREPATADLRGALLSGEDLSYRDLSGVDLSGADLTDAQLVGTNLARAVLRDARLVGARLDEAVLTGADLRGADLTRARLARADLRDIVTEGSRWDGAALIGVTASPTLAGDPALHGAAIAPDEPIAAEVAPALLGVSYGYHPQSSRLPEPIAYHPDGNTLAVGSDDGGVLICDAVSGAPLRTLHGHRGRVYKTAYSAGVLVTGAADGTVRLWDPAAGECLRVFTGHPEGVWPVVLSPSGELVVAGGADGVAHVWSVRTGEQVAALPGHTSPLHTAVFADDLVVTGDADGVIRVWELGAGRVRHELAGDHGAVYRLLLSPDGRLLAAGDSEGVVRLWDPHEGSLMREFRGHTGSVFTLSFDPTGRLLASGDAMGAIRLWDVAGNPTREALPGHDTAVHQVLFSPDGEVLASGDSGGVVRLHRLGGGRVELNGHAGSVWPFAFRPDGGQLATTGDDGTVRLWDAVTGQCRRVLRGHGRRISSVHFSADGSMLATSGNDGVVRVWEPRTGERLREFTGTSNRLASAVFSPAGPLLATSSNDGEVHLWDATTGHHEREINAGTDQIWAEAFSPDGTMLATANDDDCVKIWHRPTGRLVADLTDHRGRVRSIAFNPDGRLVATGCDDRLVRLWDAESGTLRTWLTGHDDRVYAVAFHPSGDRLASAGIDGTARIWDVTTGECLAVLREGAERLWAADFSPDGSLLATACDDHVVRLWDPVSGRRLHTLTGHTRRVSAVAFSPSGDLLASAGDDGGVIVWDVGSGAPPARRATLLGLPDGWVALSPDGRYKQMGEASGQFWFVVGMRRFEPGELDAYLPSVRQVPLNEPF
ncbi:NACHT and WD40 repeat domain-containing protein [Nonomuraea helvata]|uniref:Pentapeptide repeat-containing protein n=1 Tax=Nonomuraea helvata TaxID=37484 RepID=A0ABV5SGR5_9ACTN